jgi:hypothetical protein
MKYVYNIVFGGDWGVTQGLMLAGQVLCHLSHAPDLFGFSFFLESHAFYLGPVLD